MHSDSIHYPFYKSTAPMPAASDRDTILELTQKLLVCITEGDWDTYQELCCPSLSCFEPEALGHLVHGLDFHQYYFDLPSSNTNAKPLPVQSTIVAPHIRVMGDVAIIAYVRLTQKIADGKPVSVAMEETRVWHRQQGKWKHVHFHRSPAR
jgi:calcium/calmodulin-dependent protein kinase (CaM kinase) II